MENIEIWSYIFFNITASVYVPLNINRYNIKSEMHNSGLYSEGRIFQSTWYGGLITLALAGDILALSIVTLIDVVH